jgi:hypothetical protein
MTLSDGKSVLVNLMEELAVLVRGRRRNPFEKIAAWTAALVLAVLGAGAAYLVVKKRRSPQVRKLKRAAGRSLTSLRRKVTRALSEGQAKARSYVRRFSVEAEREAIPHHNGHGRKRAKKTRVSATFRARRRSPELPTP